MKNTAALTLSSISLIIGLFVGHESRNDEVAFQAQKYDTLAQRLEDNDGKLIFVKANDKKISLRVAGEVEHMLPASLISEYQKSVQLQKVYAESQFQFKKKDALESNRI